MKSLIKILVTSFVFVFIFIHYKVSISQLFSNEIPKPLWLFLAVSIAILVNPIFTSNRWKIFLYYAGIKERIFNLIKITFISCFYGIVLPSTVGADLIRILLIEKKHQGHKGKSGSTVIAERLLGFFLLSVIGLFGTVFLESKYWFQSKLVVVMLLITLVLFSLMFVVSNQFAFNIIKSFLVKTAQLININLLKLILSYIENLYQSLYELPLRKSFLRALPFMLCFQLSNILIGYLLFYSFGIDLAFYVHLALLPVIQILTVIPVSISGFGIREGAFVYFYSSLGVPPEIAITVSIFYFLVLTGTAAVMGGLIVLFSNIQWHDFIQKS